MSKLPIMKDPKWLSQLIDVLRHEAMVKELEDDEHMWSREVPNFARIKLSELQNENSHLLSIIAENEKIIKEHEAQIKKLLLPEVK